MTPPTPWAARVLDVLADGEPHTYDELVRAAGPLVPPGRAVRQAESERSSRRARAGATPTPLRVGDSFNVGRRDLVVRAIRSLARTGRATAGAGVAQLVRKP